MQEDQDVAGGKTAVGDQINQSGEGFAGVDGIEEYAFLPRQEADRFYGRGVWLGVGGPGIGSFDQGHIVDRKTLFTVQGLY